MSELINKLKYTLSAVNDIQSALEERGFNMDKEPLEVYGDKIRQIRSADEDNENKYGTIIFNMSSPIGASLPILPINNDIFILNDCNEYIENKDGELKVQDNNITLIEDMFTINPSVAYIYNISKYKTIDESIINLKQNMIALNSISLIKDMTLPIEEV